MHLWALLPPPQAMASDHHKNMALAAADVVIIDEFSIIIIIIIMLHSRVLGGQHDVCVQLCDCDTGERPQNPSYRRRVAHMVATKGESTHQLLGKLHPPSHTTQHTTQPQTPYPCGHWPRAL
jgi:hypothetical protein